MFWWFLKKSSLSLLSAPLSYIDTSSSHFWRLTPEVILDNFQPTDTSFHDISIFSFTPDLPFVFKRKCSWKWGILPVSSSYGRLNREHDDDRIHIIYTHTPTIHGKRDQGISSKIFHAGCACGCSPARPARPSRGRPGVAAMLRGAPAGRGGNGGGGGYWDGWMITHICIYI